MEEEEEAVVSIFVKLIAHESSTVGINNFGFLEYII